MWILYWISAVAIVVIGIVYIIKGEKKALGVVQTTLGILTPFFALLFCMNRNFETQTEINFFTQEFSKGSIYAILLTIMCVLLIGITIRNIIFLIKK